MKSIVAKALSNGYSYSEYRKIVSDLLLEGRATGNEQTDDYIQFSSLNVTRMNRLDKTIKIPEETEIKLQTLKNEYIWLVIAEGWCGDAAQIVPIFNKIANESDAIELKIVLRDQNDDLMNLFLSNGARAVPKLIAIDKKTGEVCDTWGPRPKGAVDLIKNYKAKHGVVDTTAKAELQLWYLHDKGLSTQNEIIEMMQNL